jgi:folate-binding protein YgfZ
LKQKLATLSNLTLIKVHGPDAARFLQGQVTCDITQLNETQAAFTACCDAKGRMQANFWIWQKNNDYFLLLPTSMSSILLTHLKKYAVFSKVQFTECNEESIFSYCSTNPQPEIEIHHKIDTQNTTCIRIPGVNFRYLLIGPTEHPQTPQKMQDWEWNLANIEAGITLLKPETSSLFTPQMIQLEKLGGISFTKGCYIGQEIVARTQYLGTLKRHLCKGQIDKPLTLHPGQILTNEKDEAMGVLTESATHPDFGTRLLAVVQDRALLDQKLSPLQIDGEIVILQP